MGRLHVRGVCTHACVNVRASDCILWLNCHFIWDAEHISKDKNCYFHNLLKLKKTIYSGDIIIIS